MIASDQLLLRALSPEELDQIWSPARQAVQHSEDAVEFYENQLDAGEAVSIESLQRAKDTLAKHAVEEAPYVEEFQRRNGWNRVWLALDGSMHTEAGCAGNYAQIMPYLSGKTQEEIFQRVGMAVCTECFHGITDLPEYKKVQRVEQQAASCPGSRCKAEGETCPECGQKVGVTAKGRFKVHSKTEAWI